MHVERDIEWTPVDLPADVIPSQVRWDAAKPLEIEITFGTPDITGPKWVVSRDLVFAACLRPGETQGSGDVKALVAGSRTWFRLCLSSPDGTIMLLAKARFLDEFVRRTYALVPSGEEVLDIDDCVRQLLS